MLPKVSQVNASRVRGSEARVMQLADQGPERQQASKSAPSTPKTGGGSAGYSPVYCFCVALGYMLCSTILVFFNKACLSHYRFDFVNFLTLQQLAISLVMMLALRWRRVIDFYKPGASGQKNGDVETSSGAGQLVEAAPLFVPLSTIYQMSGLSVMFLIYIIFSLASLRGVNLPMYSTLRRTTAAFTLVIEYIYLKTQHAPGIVLSVLGMVMGAVVAGVGDLQFELYGYGMVFLANLTTAMYLAVINKYGKGTMLNTFGLMWCNAVVSVPLLLLYSLLSGELQRVLQFPRLLQPDFQLVMLGSSGIAFLLNWTTYQNTIVNSALTQTICGNLKDILIVAFGFFLFGGVEFEFWNVLGIIISLGASLCYAVIKLRGR